MTSNGEVYNVQTLILTPYNTICLDNSDKVWYNTIIEYVPVNTYNIYYQNTGLLNKATSGNKLINSLFDIV